MAILLGGMCERWCEQFDVDGDPWCIGREGSVCHSDQAESQMARVSSTCLPQESHTQATCK